MNAQGQAYSLHADGCLCGPELCAFVPFTVTPVGLVVLMVRPAPCDFLSCFLTPRQHRWVVVADVRHLYIYVSGRDTAVITKKLERNIAVLAADTTYAPRTPALAAHSFSEDTNLLYVGTDDGYVLQFEVVALLHTNALTVTLRREVQHGATGICSLAICGNLFAYANKAGYGFCTCRSRLSEATDREICALNEAKHQRCLLDGQGMSDGHLVLCRMYFINSEELVVVTPASARALSW